MSAKIQITFKEGVGNLKAELSRGGVVIESESTDKSGTITLEKAQQDDGISISGACAGTATIVIVPDTVPTTPITYPAGNINDDFLI